MEMLVDSGSSQFATESFFPAVCAQITVQVFSCRQKVAPRKVSGVYIIVCRLLPKDIATVGQSKYFRREVGLLFRKLVSEAINEDNGQL